MSNSNAAEFLKEMKEFFEKIFPNFEIAEPEGRRVRYFFGKRFEKQKLSIVIFAPIKLNKKTNELEFIPDSCKRIALELRISKEKGKKKKPRKSQPRTVIYMKDTVTHSGSNWKKILKKKINLLVKLVTKEIKQCDSCGNRMVPKVSKRKDSGTFFVWLYCGDCSEYKNTTFGTRLKSRLHKLIQPKET